LKKEIKKDLRNKMSFPDKKTRKTCWLNKDAYWECLNVNDPKHNSASGEEIPKICTELRKAFEAACPNQWVKHFDRKRSFEQFKEKMSSGYDPIEELAKKEKARESGN